MFGLQFISDNLGGPAIDEVIKAWKYFLNYTKNLDDLQAKMINLGMRRDIIRRKVCEANHRGEKVEVDVLQWQAEADRLTIDVEQLIQESTAMVSIMRQYQLSKQAEEKIAHAEKLIEKSYFTDISHCRPRPPELESLSDKNYVDLKSRTPILKDIMDALKDSNVNIIGVCGLGGVGKTTLVKEVGEQMRQGGTFQQVALAIVSKDLNVKEIQSKLADSLNFDLESTGDEANRATKLWNKFNNGDKYLVILDDIWGKVDLMTIGIPITDGNTGCKVVLTSRKKDLLSITMKANRNFSIPELPEEEAWDLFKKKVGNSIESQSEIYSLAREVCRKCKGLPVAINALGAALQDKRDYAWKNALDKLERCMLTQIEGVDPSVEASLRVSYDMLQSLDAQSCFLLCCLFPEDADIPIYKLTRHYIASSLFAQNSRTYIEARNAVCTIIDALKSASLLTTGGHEGAVKIHDVIRDVGVSIAREEKAFLIDHGVLRWPRNPTNKPSYSAISLSFNNIRELPDGLVYPQLHTLMVDNSELSNLEVPDNFFNGMAQLTVLTFKRFRMRRLPSSLAKLTNLQMLSLNGCELEDIAILKELKCNLEVLDLQGSRIEALPPEIGQLASLRVLDIESCDKLTVIPRGVISNLTSLEVLYFPKEFDAWEATIDEQQDMSSRDNVSLEELRWLLNNDQLIYLKIHIPDVTLLPKEGLIFANLIEFTISMGSRSEDPKALIFGTCFLEIQGVQLRSEFIPLVDKAQVLKVGGIKGLKKVLHDRGIGNGFLNLKYLEVTSCDDDLEDFLGEPKLSMQSHGLHPSQSFNKLAVLIIKKCKLKFLFSPTTAREFVHLERLEVRSCEIIEAIVGFEVQDDENELIFSKLRILELGDLPNLTSFYAEKEKTQKTTGSSFARPQPLFSPKVVLPVLEKLNVEELDGIEEIWDKQSPSVNQKTVSFGQLRKMTVRQCKKLMNLVPSNILPRLGNLQTLNVGGCPNVKFIVFKHGKEGEAAAADNTLINIPQLRSLSIWNMENLKSFYSSSTTSNAQSLFNHQVILPVLEKISVEKLDVIEDIWDKQSPSVHQMVSFGQLRIMTVRQCKKLMNLVPSNILPRLRSLQTLYVEGCPNVEFVVFKNGKEEEEAADDDSTLVIRQLRSLSIRNMENLKSFYSSSTTSNGHSFFNHQVILPVLEELIVEVLDGIEEIWDKQSPSVHQMVSLGQLRIMTIRQCKKLMNLIPSNILPRLRNLQSLYVHGCPNIEFIVFKNGKEEEVADDDNTLVIPQLRRLFIQNMGNLKSFYSSSTTSNAQFLFNHEVIFPILEVLFIRELDSIEEIWDKQSPSVNEKTASFSKLRNMTVRECKKLMNLVPSNILPRLRNLQELRVDGCPNVEFVVFKNGKEENEAADDRTLIIPQLSYLEIRSMENLKSFYSSSTTSNAQSLFNHQESIGICVSIVKERYRGSNDVLTMALGGNENSSRVRGVGGKVTPSIYFHLPRRENHSSCEEKQRNLQQAMSQMQVQLDAIKQHVHHTPHSENIGSNTLRSDNLGNPEFETFAMESRVRTKGKYGISKPKPNLKKSKPCRLAVGSINNIVANGTMFEKVGPNELLHTTPLGEANMRVSIDVVKVREALLPIPIPGEAATVGEAVGCYVAWPRSLILFAPEVPSKKPGVIGNESKPCRLALGSVNNIVAHGTMFWKSGPNEVLHTTLLGEGNMRVCIDVVKVSDAILPIPIPGEATTVGEAVGCRVAWPKNLIYFAPEVASKKPVGIGNQRALKHHGVVGHGVVADAATSKDVEWEKNLETIGLFAIFVENTSKEDAMIIPLEKDIFGDEVEAHLQKVDMEYICQMKEVSGTCIMLYIRQLYRGIKASNMNRRFVFVNPCLLSGRMVAENLKPGLLAKRLEDVKEDQLLFVPCNFGFHWVLCIIDLYSDSSPVVYLMDSINKDFSLSLKIMINTVFSIYDKAKGRRIRVIPVLKVVECPKQPTNVECGFYVMKYMKDVIKEERILRSGSCKGKRTYTQAEIDEVRVEWINSVLNC